jgi:Calcineurin-like phosphoesterase/Purple acid Phosphatase, N-terminal domain
MSAPTLAYSTERITHDRPGDVIELPEAQPLDVSKRYPRVVAVSFRDGLNGQTTYHYHVQLTGLEPATQYYYQVSDGAAPPSTGAGSFRTAPPGRARFRFSSYGDLSTPSWDRNASGQVWFQSCDNAYYAVNAIEEPGDGEGPPLFHLMNGDLCYANLDYENAPGVWRDFGVNISRSAANRPWMPALGNHETEFGICARTGKPATIADGDSGSESNQAAQGNRDSYHNGPYGYGSYLARFLLPDNGVTNHDRNRLRNHFYSFQVGTVKFISLDADDVIYQDSGATWIRSDPNARPLTTSSGASIPNGTSIRNLGYTGDLAIHPADNSAKPDFSNGRPNLQTIWLEHTLAAARSDPSVDMIVVFMHQCAMSSARANGADMGIRRAWLPLFDRYQVDLVLSGHEHNYERTYPVRGYDPGELGTVTSPNPGQVKGKPVDTRCPHVVTTEPATTGDDGTPAWDTECGTVFVVLGCAGSNAPSNKYLTDPATGRRQAKVHTQPNAITGSRANGFRRNGADSVEDATWSAVVNPREGFGYAIFDVDPGERPGDTTITMKFFAIPAVSRLAGPLHDGTTTLPTTPYETVTFGRSLSRHPRQPRKTES